MRDLIGEVSSENARSMKTENYQHKPSDRARTVHSKGGNLTSHLITVLQKLLLPTKE